MSEDTELQSLRIHREYSEALRSLVRMMQPYTFLREDTDTLAAIANSEAEPFSVAMLGYMKTGKSSLINALIGEPLAIIGVEETTATINRLSYADGEQLDTFTVHWKDTPPETFPITALKSDWNGKSEDVLERVMRVSHLELYSNNRRMRNVHIIDTPGIGSSTDGHEKVAQQFIKDRQADALVYVCPPVGREIDEVALATYLKGSTYGSAPYNSVAIMHLWDEDYWNNGGDMEKIRGKAAYLYEQMHEMVAEVLPVSAPLALLAKKATPIFWNDCLVILADYDTEEELIRNLRNDSKWDRSAAAAALREQSVQQYSLPWVCFQVALRHLYRHRAATPEQAKQLILDISGIIPFEEMLDKRFFSHQAVIRRQHTRRRVKSVLETIYRRIEDETGAISRKINYLERIAGEVHTQELEDWLNTQIAREKELLDGLKKRWVEIDEMVIKTGNERDKEEIATDIERWVNDIPTHYLTSEQTELLKTLIRTQSAKGLMHQIPALFKHITVLTRMPDETIRQQAEKLKEIISHILQKSHS